ncbi:MAG TPA: biotin--[acetyl-CoA-carboxylase] ligase, partial [Candidatus Hypogeohydataceae bacterium YC41]
MSRLTVLEVLHERQDKWVSLRGLIARTALSEESLRLELRHLEQVGYSLEHHPRYGYRLRGIPDRLLPDEIQRGLQTSIIGREILTYEEVDSTMDVTKAMAEKGAREGTCVFAEFQRSGRGRANRRWLCPKFKGLLLSVILRPKIPYKRVCFLSGTVAVAVAEAIRDELSLEALIKWPNDILINNKKVCGILVEAETPKGKEPYFFIGIGLNVNLSNKEIPKEVMCPATSLLIESGHLVDRISMARAILKQLDNWYNRLKGNDYKGIKERWVRLSPIIGHRALVEGEGIEYTGRIIDLSTKGGVIMELDSGGRKTFRWEYITIKEVF